MNPGVLGTIGPAVPALGIGGAIVVPVPGVIVFAVGIPGELVEIGPIVLAVGIEGVTVGKAVGLTVSAVGIAGVAAVWEVGPTVPAVGIDGATVGAVGIIMVGGLVVGVVPVEVMH